MNLKKIIPEFFKEKIDCFDSFDYIPLFNWNKYIAKKDLSYLMKHKYKFKTKYTEQLTIIWNNIFNEFIDTFGIPEKLVNIKKLELEIAVDEWQMVRDSNRSLQTFINIKKARLSHLLEDKQPIDLTNKQLSIIEDYKGRKLDDKTLTAKDFFSYVVAYNEEMALRKRN